MKKIDARVHACPGWPEAFVSTDDALEAAAGRVDGVVLAGRSLRTKATRANLWNLGKLHGVLAFCGAVLSTEQGVDVMVVGVDPGPVDVAFSRPVDFRGLARWVRSRGGATIALAPLSRMTLDEARASSWFLRLADRIEAVGNGQREDMAKTAELGTFMSKPLVSSSGAHHAKDVGKFWTGVDDSVETEADLVAFLRMQT